MTTKDDFELSSNNNSTQLKPEDDSESSSNNNSTQSRRGRGRPVGTGRKRAAGSSPKMFRNFSPFSGGMLAAIHLIDPEFMKMTGDEIIENGLVEYIRALSNRLSNSNPKAAKRLAEMLRRNGR
jgi:hypothetical protein